METFAVILILIHMCVFIPSMIIAIKIRNKEESSNKSDVYNQPEFKQLSQDEIYHIHSKGKLTAQEWVKQWESLGVCAPGDHSGSAAWRCEQFNNCHDCLVDYVNNCETDEFDSIYDDLKIVNLDL